MISKIISSAGDLVRYIWIYMEFHEDCHMTTLLLDYMLK